MTQGKKIKIWGFSFYFSVKDIPLAWGHVFPVCLFPLNDKPTKKDKEEKKKKPESKQEQHQQQQQQQQQPSMSLLRGRSSGQRIDEGQFLDLDCQ